jgi:hypothetical protein
MPRCSRRRRPSVEARCSSSFLIAVGLLYVLWHYMYATIALRQAMAAAVRVMPTLLAPVRSTVTARLPLPLPTAACVHAFACSSTSSADLPSPSGCVTNPSLVFYSYSRR